MSLPVLPFLFWQAGHRLLPPKHFLTVKDTCKVLLYIQKPRFNKSQIDSSVRTKEWLLSAMLFSEGCMLMWTSAITGTVWPKLAPAGRLEAACGPDQRPRRSRDPFKDSTLPSQKLPGEVGFFFEDLWVITYAWAIMSTLPPSSPSLRANLQGQCSQLMSLRSTDPVCLGT